MLAICRDHWRTTSHCFDKYIAEPFGIRTKNKSICMSEIWQRIALISQEVDRFLQVKILRQRAQAGLQRSGTQDQQASVIVLPIQRHGAQQRLVILDRN